jgi:hypothetical protein
MRPTFDLISLAVAGRQPSGCNDGPGGAECNYSPGGLIYFARGATATGNRDELHIIKLNNIKNIGHRHMDNDRGYSGGPYNQIHPTEEDDLIVPNILNQEAQLRLDEDR